MEELKMANFLKTDFLPIETAKFIAKIQCNMVEECPTNFKGSGRNELCNNCNKENLNQEHLLYCNKLLEINSKLKHFPNYKDIYGNNTI